MQHSRSTQRRIYPSLPRTLPLRRALRALPLLLAALIAAPIGLVAAELLSPDRAIWAQLWETVLPRMLANTLLLALGVGLGTLVLGCGLAWLVSAYRFPGRGLFAWALLLPLAMPTYVLGFVFLATFDFAGPVQTSMRRIFGPDVWSPPIRSGFGAVLVLSLTLYPYVYVLARAAFREQAPSTFEAARLMGLSRSRAFLRLALPLARPSLAAGVTLAMLEALTDIATVRFFAFPTLSLGLLQVWEGMLSRAAALELASLLLAIALSLLLVERALRGQARYTQESGTTLGLPPSELRGPRAWAATLACALVLGLAFVLPTARLLAWALAELARPTMPTPPALILRYISTSLALAAAASLLTVLAALLLVGARPERDGRLGRVAVRLSTLGYALPGAVIAAGTIMLLAGIDRGLIALGLSGGLLLTGSVLGLLYAYLVRFLAVAHGSVDASFQKLAPSMLEAARCMGASPARVALRVQAPLVGAGLLAAALLVFVDVMKELPATLLLRPFGMDTLAIWTYMLAAESFWQAAALPALLILLSGLLPVILLVRAGERGMLR